MLTQKLWSQNIFPDFRPVEAENALEISREGMGNRNPHQVLRWPFLKLSKKWSTAESCVDLLDPMDLLENSWEIPFY